MMMVHKNRSLQGAAKKSSPPKVFRCFLSDRLEF